jgi:protein gp37
LNRPSQRSHDKNRVDHYTWNLWWGCDKIAPECDHCYAASGALRNLHENHVAGRSAWVNRRIHANGAGSNVAVVAFGFARGVR